nr:hypothetical protein [Tanacetum cinerariifolium]
MTNAKERCMAYFRLLHSHLKVLSNKDLKGTRIEHGFKRAFMSLFDRDDDTFTSTMLLNIDQLQNQLDKDEFQEGESMTAFWVINRQFQKFIDLQFTLDYDSQMADKVNKRQMQTQESKIGMGKALDADQVITKSSRTELEVQDDSNMSGNDTDVDDVDIRPIYDEEPMTEVQLTAESNIFAIGQQHTEQPEIIYEGRVGQWKPMGRILNTVGLRWAPTGNIFTSCTSKADSESTYGSKVDISRIHKCNQTLDLSASTSLTGQQKQKIDFSADMIVMTSMIELESIFDPLFDEYLNGENLVISKSFAFTTADASNKRQQQPDSASSTSTLATTVTADGNFDL